MAISRLVFTSLALLNFVIGLKEASAQITLVPPFVGTHSETWESFRNGVPKGTPIFGGIATASGNSTGTSFRMCTVFAEPSDGKYLAFLDRPAAPWTISFSQPVSAFGAYWGTGFGCSPFGFDDSPIILTFRDVQGNVVGTDSFDYVGGGELSWHGYRFSRPVASVTRTAGDGKEGFAVDGLQAIVASSSPNSTQLANISTRGFVQSGDNVLIAGFIITGGNSKEVLLRGLGPTLGQPPFNVSNALADPLIQLHMPDGTIDQNDDWQLDPNGGYIPQELRPANPKESAILRWLGPGSYTAVLKGANNATGNALVEVYDFDDLTTAKLSNLSTRCFVQNGDNVVIAGFIVNGSSPQRIVIRGIGPSLAASPFNVPQALADPLLDLRDVNGESLFTNDNWRESQEAQIRASGLAPSNAFESAIDITVAPGNYTAILSGTNGASGNGLVEVYALN